MRTTLTLDPDVARMLEEATHREKRSFKEVVNDAIRRGLRQGASRPPGPYTRKPHPGGFQPEIDSTTFKALASQVEDDELLEKVRRSR